MSPESECVEDPPSGTATKMLVIESNGRYQRSLARCLKATVGDVEARSELGPLPNDGDFDLIIACYEAIAPPEREALFERFSTRCSATRLLLLSDGSSHDELLPAMEKYYLTNLMGKVDEVDIEELVVTARKILDDDLFGLEKYFIWGVEPISMKVISSTQKEKVLATAEDFANNIGVNPRFVSQFCTVVEEVVTNALYNAPVDATGAHRFSSLSRSETVTLEDHEAIEIKLCCDGQRLGVSACDPFGSLSEERVLQYLAKCLRRDSDQVDTKEGGAGLGLYHVFDALSHFIINLERGRRTEVVGLIDVRGNYRDFGRRPKSFNIFI